MSESKKDDQTVSLTNDVTIDLNNDPYYAKDGVFSVNLDGSTNDTITIDIDSDYTLTFDDTIVIGDGTNFTTTRATDWSSDVSVTGGKWGVYTSDNVSFPWESEYKLWEHCLPSLSEVEEMCKEYPALEKAFKNFETIYKMVEQDYKGKKEDDS